MSIFSRVEYALVNIETKEDVYVSKEFLEKEYVLKEIEKENLPDVLYRHEERKSGRKVRNAWVMRKPRKAKSPEELAVESRKEAEEFMLSDALDIKDRVEKHNAFKAKVVEMYGIEGVGNVDKIQIPSGKDGNLGIIEAAQIATAQSVFRGISETKPTEVSDAFKSVMNSGTTILAGIAQIFTARITESNKRKEKPAEKKKDLEKKKEEPKDLETKKEIVSEGVTKTTFGTEESTEPTYSYQKQEISSTSSDVFNGSDTPVSYEQYERDMMGINKEEEVEEEPEKE